MIRYILLALGLLVLSLSGSTTRAAYSPEIIDPREYGARCNGTADDTAALQQAITAAQAKKANIIWPAATCYSATGITISTPMAIIGQNMLPQISDANPAAGGGTTGSSRLTCPNTANITCLTLSFNVGSKALSGVHIENLIISSSQSGINISSGTADPTSRGLFIDNGGGFVFTNVQIKDFGTCFNFTATGAGGVTLRYNTGWIMACSKHYMVFDGVPDAQVRGVSIGSLNDYSTPDEGVLFTRTRVVGAGGGPNTITFDSVQMGVGDNTVMPCWLKWGGVTTSVGLIGEYRFNNMHLENHNRTDLGSTFCSDASIPKLSGIFVDKMIEVGYDGTHYRSLFNLNPKTALEDFHITDSSFGNCFYTGAPNMFNLAPVPDTGPAFNTVHFHHNSFCIGPTLRSNNTGQYMNAPLNTFFSSGNMYGDMTLSGTWYDFNSVGDHLITVNDTAKGQVAMSGSHSQPWLPDLQFSTTTPGVTYGYRYGFWQRTTDGGFNAQFGLALTAFNSGGAGNASIQMTNMPIACEPQALFTAYGGSSIAYAQNMAGLVGTVGATLESKAFPPPTRINLNQNGSTGTVGLTPANFSATSIIAGEVHCAKAWDGGS